MITRRRAIKSLVGVAVSSLFVGRYSAWAQAAGSANPQPTPAGPLTQATVTVADTPNGTIGSDFMGLSYEKTHIAHPLFSPSNKNTIAFFNLIGPGMLRIGGCSPDVKIWTPDGDGKAYPTVTEGQVDQLAEFLKVSGWNCLYCINLAGSATGRTTPELAAAEVAYVADKLGSSLYGIEIGNEPNLYGRGPVPGFKYGETYFAAHKPWNLQIYEALWNQYRDAIIAKTPDVFITGPAAGYLPSWTIPFSKDQTKSKLGLMTDHYYANHGLPAAKLTVDTLIKPDERLLSNLKLMRDAQQVTGIPFRVAEGNTFAGSDPAVCDRYATSLWVLDYMYTIAEGGATGVNITSDSGKGSYTPLADNYDSVIEIRPEFYGMLLFALAGQGTINQTTVDAAKLNVTAYTVKTPTGMNVVIVNKDLTQNLQVTVRLPQAVNSANLIAMTQHTDGAARPDLSAQSGVTIQGATVGLDGSFSPAAPYTLATSGSSITCYVPALSAALIKTT